MPHYTNTSNPADFPKDSAMNERFAELANKAGFVYIKDEGIGWAGNYNASLEKFAELIVRECADIAREVGTNTEPEDFALDRCYEIESKIKEYFGVE